MPENPLDVEQVEKVGSIVGNGAMEDPGSTSAKIVRAHVPKSCRIGMLLKQHGDAAGLLEGVAPAKLARSAARLLAAHHRIAWLQGSPEGGFVVGEVVAQELEERRSDGHPAGPVLLADPLHGGLAVQPEVPYAEGRDLGYSHPGQPQSQHQLVPATDVGGVAGPEQLAVGLLVGQPAGGVLALQLPVDGGRRPERILPALELLDEGGVGRARPDAPAEERADPGQTVAAGVIRSGARHPLVYGPLGEGAGLRDPDVSEQGRQLGQVLVGRLGIGVATTEPLDQGRQRGPFVLVGDLPEAAMRVKRSVS